MHRGYVKLHRKFKQWEWYKDPNVKLLFLELLLSANHTATRYKGFDIPAGSLVSGRIALADQTGLSVQQVRTALNKLKSTSEVTSQPTHDFSIISISNWNEYQASNQPSNQQATSQQPASNQPATTSKECKNEDNGKNEKKKANGADVEKVFLFWQSTMNHPKARLTADKQKRIQKWLKSDYSETQLRQAIAGCNLTDWYMGRGDSSDGSIHDGLNVIFKHSENIDKFIETYERSRNG